MSESPARFGFTLVEVMVALVIGSMAVAGAAALLGGLGDRAEAIDLAGSRADADANAERLLRALAENLDIGFDTMPPLAGSADSMAFRAWCQTPGGWLDRCAVRLLFDHRQGVAVFDLELRGADSSTLTLRHGFDHGRFRYLEEVDHRLRWVESWSRRAPPGALGIVIDADTLLLPLHVDG
jgi:prepilin-type N-terminal cleavage/methylation domain-containing protein